LKLHCHINPVFYTGSTDYFTLPLLIVTSIAGLVAGALAYGVTGSALASTGGVPLALDLVQQQ
jgi:hypothetical protein